MTDAAAIITRRADEAREHLERFYGLVTLNCDEMLAIEAAWDTLSKLEAERDELRTYATILMASREDAKARALTAEKRLSEAEEVIEANADQLAVACEILNKEGRPHDARVCGEHCNRARAFLAKETDNA